MYVTNAARVGNKMRVLAGAALHSESEHGVTLHVADGHTLSVVALEEDMIRVCIDRDGQKAVNSSWMVAPSYDTELGRAAAPYEGRSKDDLSGFALPRVTIESADGQLRISTSRLRVTIPLHTETLALSWEWHDISAACWRSLFADRRTGAYYFGRCDARLAHHIKRRRGDKFYGLGEKSGCLERGGRRFRMDCVDAMGYDAERSDPLYKFWPFYIAKPAPPATAAGAPEASSAAYGLFYDNPANCAFDLGCTFDNYHGLFSSYEATCGDLDYTVILGPSVLEVTRRFAWLIGGHCLPPIWSSATRAAP